MSFINNTNISSLLSLLPGFGEPELTLSNKNRTVSNIFTMAVYKVNLNSLMRKIFYMLSQWSSRYTLVYTSVHEIFFGVYEIFSVHQTCLHEFLSSQKN